MADIKEQEQEPMSGPPAAATSNPDIPESERAPTMTPLERMRHSAAHVLADAVLEIFPEAKLGIGPPIDEGFYYDFDLPRTLTPDDLTDIEARMRRIIESNVPFEYSTLPRAEAERFFRERGQDYKLELIRDLDEPEYGIYTSGKFVDLCRGPHMPRTGDIGPFKLLSVAGAYWRGDEHRPMLQRVYGTAFPTQAELDDYLHKLEEAARRDHRKLGRELDLFGVSDEVGPGLIIWYPKGAVIRQEIEKFWYEAHRQAGYETVYTPHVGRAALWQRSGHLGFYKENMYAEMDIEGQGYYMKPMNCPFHIQVYQSRLRSYRDLPVRLGELGTVYRYEKGGVLHGLLRVRGFTQDDAHIFCRPDQIEDEIVGVIDLTKYLLGAFGFDEYEVFLSTRPEKSIGEDALWEAAENALRRALERRNMAYQVDAGGGAFYGPKIDIKIRDALGRAWQCTTIQFDFNMSERFDLEYIGEDNKPHRPYMVHRALLGSLERFFGVLIEHYAGAFPVWLAPVQAVVVPIADRHVEYAERVKAELEAAGLRVSVDARNERMQLKIRDAQLQKVPYILVVGDKEAQAGAAAVRLRSGENLGAVPVAEITARIAEEARTRALPGRAAAQA